MADDKGFWIAVVEYKWIFAAIALARASFRFATT